MDQQTQDPKKISIPALPDDAVMVKDYDGSLKILSDGELKELDAILSKTEVVKPADVSSDPVPANLALAIPKFTDLAVAPNDHHFKEPDRQHMPDAKAELHFHPEDRDEIQRELEKLNQVFSVAPQKKFSIIKIADKLIEKHALKLDADTRKAFVGAMLSYFRQARNSVESKAVLVAPRAGGGIGLAAETADHVMAIARSLKEKIEEADGSVVLQDAPESTVPPVSPRPAFKPTESAPTPVASGMLKPESAPVVPAKPTPVERTSAPVTPPAPKIEPAVSEPVRTTSARPTTRTAPAPQPIPAPATSVTQPRPAPTTGSIISDVRPTPTPSASRGTKPMGKIEELAAMDLITWRMLDADPRIRAGKILGKIQSLESESLIRKSQGVDAWRSSETYRHYLMIGQRSLEGGMSVADTIAAMTAAGMPTLDVAEFDAISDLNRTLRY